MSKPVVSSVVVASQGGRHARLVHWALYAGLGLLAILTLYPFVFMVETSLRSTIAFLKDPLGLPLAPRWANYETAFSKIWRFGLNSLLVTGVTTALVIVTGSTAAYALARLRFRFRDAVFYSMIAIMMVPFLVVLVPLFLWVKQLGLLNSYAGLILPYAAFNVSLAVFILRTFFGGLDESLFEACRVDGGSEWMAFWRIAVPLARPILGTVAILTALSTWNDFLWALVAVSKVRLFTLPLGEVEFSSRYSTHYGPLMAAYTLGAAPLIILFILVNRSFVESFTRAELRA